MMTVYLGDLVSALAMPVESLVDLIAIKAQLTPAEMTVWRRGEIPETAYWRVHLAILLLRMEAEMKEAEREKMEEYKLRLAEYDEYIRNFEKYWKEQDEQWTLWLIEIAEEQSAIYEEWLAEAKRRDFQFVEPPRPPARAPVSHRHPTPGM